MKSAKIKYSREFEKLVFEKAMTLESEGLSQGFLDNTPFREWEIFLNIEPKHCIYKVTMKNDSPVLGGKIIYVGWND